MDESSWKKAVLLEAWGAREIYVFLHGNVRPSRRGSGSRASLPRDGDEEVVVEGRVSWT
jgi:hypothetical protein